ALSPERAPLLAPLGEPLTQTVTFTSAGPAPLVDPTLTVHLPQGFLFDGMTGEQQGPTVGTDGTLTWQLDDIIPFESSVTFEYRIVPGMTLGTFGTSANVAAF